MLMKFDSTFNDEELLKINDFLLKPQEHKKYEIEFPAGLNDPPPKEVARMFMEGSSFEMKEQMMRYSIKGKPVRVLLDGEYCDQGGFTANTLTEDIGAYPVFKEHAYALFLLIELCTNNIFAKYLPSRKSTDNPEVAKK